MVFIAIMLFNYANATLFWHCHRIGSIEVVHSHIHGRAHGTGDSSGGHTPGQLQVIDVINSLPCAKLIASHDLDFIYDTCPKTILLSGGRTAFAGDTAEVLRDRALLEAHGLELPLSFFRM